MDTRIIRANCGTEILIDAEDFEALATSDWKIRSDNGGHNYACKQVNVGKFHGVRWSWVFYIHKILTGTLYLGREFTVDHVNGNTLDNRKCNLRVCSPARNAQNRTRLCRRNKSGKMGVFWLKSRSKWVGAIWVNGKQLVKHFQSFEEALAWRSEQEIRFFGEFSGADARASQSA